MLFNSYIFIFIFLPITLVFYYASKKHYGRTGSFIVLILASLVYYAYWKLTYLPILLLSIFANYNVGMLLSCCRNRYQKKYLLMFGISANLATLAYYKYADFLIGNIQWMTGDAYTSYGIMLPLAISFFTFQQIAYLVDASQGKTREYSFSHYCLFISFFPQLIAGPIVHHKEMIPQFTDASRCFFDQQMFSQGLQQFCLGLFKKVIIADTVALYATPVFVAADQGLPIHLLEAWIGTLAYAFQLYFDFSAYSDMAIGIGKMFGIELPKNFNSPYKAKSISDFWRRWHMTLSRFLRDYLYIGLGGNRQGGLRRYANLLLTMILGGLWHGASWNFVAWGALHGFYLMLNHSWHRLISNTKLNTKHICYRVSAQLLTFFVVIEAWVLFRSATFDGAMIIYRASFDLHAFTQIGLQHINFTHVSNPIEALLWLFACAWIVFVLPNSQEFIESRAEKNKAVLPVRLRTHFSMALLCSGLLVLSISSMNKVSEFLYFQF
jgi:alginate O-acetyltransferase complex protein AlgI